MRVKVHPHKTMVNAGVEACVSITPDRKHGRAYYMGTVYLTNVDFRIHQSGVLRAQAEQVRNVHAWAVGTLLAEQKEQYRPGPDVLRNMAQVTYHYNVGRFLTMENEPVDVTDGHFKAAIIVGRDFFISKDW